MASHFSAKKKLNIIKNSTYSRKRKAVLNNIVHDHKKLRSTKRIRNNGRGCNIFI